jgi:hypothetical protein
MELDPGLMREWIEAARALQNTMERFPQRHATDGQPSATMHTGNVSVRVDDGKTHRLMLLSVFSAIFCAVLSLITILAVLGGGMLYLNMKDHLDAIYMMAPQLNQPTGAKRP